MNTKVTIVSIEFYSFKAFSRFSVRLPHLSILVGPNNSGKSTILSAFRVLAAGIRRARSKVPELVDGPTGRVFGYPINQETLPISIENVHTDYADTDTEVVFKLSNGNRLQLFFSKDGSCNLIPVSEKRRVSSPTTFKEEFPITIGLVPVLGPVEHREEVLSQDTVRQALSTHRASRHFRNYWYQNKEGFDEFAALLAYTWPGMEIEFPYRVDTMNKELAMFCREDRIPRELYWCGFGFQIWCQLLTHISRSTQESIIVIDEPEIYLHPDIQRQLLGILRDAGPDVILATHSTEIMSEADPTEILVIDKSKKSAERLRDIKGVQAALELIGSVQNITLTQLARNRRVLFVEDLEDYQILRRFARLLNFTELYSGVGLTPIKSGGFSSWEQIRSLTWGMDKLGGELSIGAVFDRDYWCVEEIDSITENLRRHLHFAHIHSRKEIENYLLLPSALERAIKRALDERNVRADTPAYITEPITDILEGITSSLRGEVQAQYISKRSIFFSHSSRDQATIIAETTKLFEEKWASISSRMEIVPGKEVLKRLRTYLQDNYSVSLTSFRIIEAFKRDDIPSDLLHLLQTLDNFRKSN